MNKTSLYPLKFNPILKEKIWGGTRLSQALGKTSNSNCIGESWELSGIDNNVSIICNGVLKNKTLKEIVNKYGTELLGNKNSFTFGDKFPLLIKIY